MNFFFDANISYRIAYAVRSLAEYDGDHVEHIKDKYGADAKDPVWLPALAFEGGWIIVSGDCKIRKKPEERKLFLKCGLTTFFLAPGWVNMLFWDQAPALIARWPKIREQAGLVAPGTVFEIPHSRRGRFKTIVD